MSASRTLGRYDIGDLVRMRATFVSTDLLTPADPSTIFLRLLLPDNTVACWAFSGGSVARAGVGAYFLDYTPTVYGDHYFNFTGTGGVQAADEWHFEVRHSRFVL